MPIHVCAQECTIMASLLCLSTSSSHRLSCEKITSHSFKWHPCNQPPIYTMQQGSPNYWETAAITVVLQYCNTTVILCFHNSPTGMGYTYINMQKNPYLKFSFKAVLWNSIVLRDSLSDNLFLTRHNSVSLVSVSVRLHNKWTSRNGLIPLADLVEVVVPGALVKQTVIQ